MLRFGPRRSILTRPAIVAAGGGGPSFTTWDTSAPRKSTDIDLTNNDLTATNNTGGGFVGVKAIDGIDLSANTGYFEVTIDNRPDTFLYVGVARDNWNPTGNVLGGGLDQLGWRANGAVTVNNSSIGTANTFTTGDIVAICIKSGDFYGRVYSGGSWGDWNNDASADPETDTGGFATGFSSITHYPAMSCFTVASAVTANFGDSAYQGAGFTYADGSYNFGP